MNLQYTQDILDLRWPTFFIVGAAKAGTSSLHQYLSQHPAVYMCPIKEPHFFSEVKSHNIDEYKKPRRGRQYHSRIVREASEYLALFTESPDAAARGESSPSYLWDAEAASRIRKAVPDARIIILLRDPVERAYSHYLMDVATGLQKQPFLDAVRADFTSPDKGWGTSHLYVELGRYCEQVRRYLDTFGRPNVLIVQFEEFSSHTRTVVERVLNFIGALGTSGLCHIDFEEKHNAYAPLRNGLAKFLVQQPLLKQAIRCAIPAESLRTKLKTHLLLKEGAAKPPINRETAEFLWSIYEDDISRLEALLGSPLPSLRRTQIC